MAQDDRRVLIEQYGQGYGELLSSVEELDPGELDQRPGPDEWTAREVVHHLADSEMTSAIRLRRLIVEDQPSISSYDEAEFARRLHYADRPIEPALEAIRAARSTTIQILERLTESEWQRSGTHSEHGEYSVTTWLRIYAPHAHDHANQIRRARMVIG